MSNNRIIYIEALGLQVPMTLPDFVQDEYALTKDYRDLFALMCDVAREQARSMIDGVRSYEVFCALRRILRKGGVA